MNSKKENYKKYANFIIGFITNMKKDTYCENNTFTIGIKPYHETKISKKEYIVHLNILEEFIRKHENNVVFLLEKSSFNLLRNLNKNFQMIECSDIFEYINKLDIYLPLENESYEDGIVLQYIIKKNKILTGSFLRRNTANKTIYEQQKLLYTNKLTQKKLSEFFKLDLTLIDDKDLPYEIFKLIYLNDSNKNRIEAMYFNEIDKIKHLLFFLDAIIQNNQALYLQQKTSAIYKKFNTPIKNSEKNNFSNDSFIKLLGG